MLLVCELFCSGGGAWEPLLGFCLCVLLGGVVSWFDVFGLEIFCVFGFGESHDVGCASLEGRRGHST